MLDQKQGLPKLNQVLKISWRHTIKNKRPQCLNQCLEVVFRMKPKLFRNVCSNRLYKNIYYANKSLYCIPEKKTKNTLNSEIKIKELATQKPYSQ